MLSTPWEQRKKAYDFVVIGSGYGGAITAARLASANLNPKPSVCVLERGREWPLGQFPETIPGVIGATRSSQNPLGLFEMLTHPDISIVKGSGLGGTSLINANVAIVPDREIFEQTDWPRSVNYDAMQPYYQRARQVLAPCQHPNGHQLGRVKALEQRAKQIGTSAKVLDIVVNFSIDGKENPYGVVQNLCTNCGNCVTGCNIGAKNTLYMNYLPMAHRAGATILTQTKVEWLEKLTGGGWRIHGRHYKSNTDNDQFTLEAREVVLSAGSLNSTEILLRSEMHGLSVSPVLGTRFSGNGDFFGLTYNGDDETDVLGYRYQEHPGPGDSPEPGPSIVGIVRYNGNLPQSRRIVVEDFSFPSAYADAAKAVFGAVRGDDTTAGNEDAQRDRLLRDLNPANRPRDPHGAMNHSMLYLVMGQDDARGTILWDTPLTEPDGRIRISWDKVGQQQVFTRMNEELRRHARALRGNFISNPTWNVFELRHLVTAHPLGGCPMGEDYLQGAVDEFNRVFSGNGSVHEGLYVSDGSVIPSALGVNPFMTISAVTERFVDRKIQQLQGQGYPAPKAAVSMSTLDPRAVAEYNEGQLEALFRRCQTLGLDLILNQGGAPAIDLANRSIRNDRYWKGFFPKGHVLNAMSSALFAGFKKEFFKKDGDYKGLTTDSDGRIRANNTLEMVNVPHGAGTLEPGQYILLRYPDFPWQGYYDIFKVINENLMIGRVYLGSYPNGVRLFTFPMTRLYSFDHLTVDDHRALFSTAPAPTSEELQGVWRMDVISNANAAGAIAYLYFDRKPDGRLEARYQLMGLLEGLVAPSFLKDHFQLNDFTPFHDEIRKISPDMLIGKYITQLPHGLAQILGSASLGLFHSEPDGNFGFYYTLSRAEAHTLPANRLLQPFLEAQLPDGVGLSFDEKMEGWYFPGVFTPGPGRDGDLTIGARIPSTGTPAGAVPCTFEVDIVARDLNEFVDGWAHEAGLIGRISFGSFEGPGPVTLPIDAVSSRFNYLKTNPATGEAEMNYHIEFQKDNRRFAFEGRKFLQRDQYSGAIRELLQDYTTLYCHVYEQANDGTRRETGTAYMKFRTFEDLAAVGNLAGFLNSFQITGTEDPLIQFQARMRFMAFTAQFVGREYDPLGPAIAGLAGDVRQEVLRGAATPDYFSTQPSAQLQTVLRDTPTLGLEALVNKGGVRIDFDKQRISRDSFWKGSFAKDSLLGWEERVRTSLFSGSSDMGRIFAGGSFWKRFDRVQNSVANGYVVNYQMTALPGLPEVRQISYPDNNRRYFKKGDSVLLLTYTNDPYKIVYDTIKVIDEQNAIGVMHLGTFPEGFEFATFVMARNNYPFDNLSVEDHRAIFADARTSVPTPSQLEGEWNGHVIFISSPDTKLMNRANPVMFHLSFHAKGAGVEARFRLGLATGQATVETTSEFIRMVDQTSFHDEIRMIDSKTLIGKWVSPDVNPQLLHKLGDYLEPQANRFAFYYILKRL